MKSKLLGGFWLLCGILCFFYCALIRFRFGFGTMFFLIWGCLGFLLCLLGAGLLFGIYDKIPQFIKRVIKVLGITFILCFLLVEGFIVGKFNAGAKNGADYIIILGAQMKADGPSDALERRLIAAAEYIKENPETKIIVSGGQGSNEPVSEAQGMKDYLVEKYGIEEDRILMEDQSENTRENLIFSKNYITGENNRIIIVTNNFHLYRASFLARKLGYENIEGIAASSYIGMLPNNLLREFFGVIKDLMV